MTALNSFSVARDLFSYSGDQYEWYDFGRTFSEKGIIVIPYDTSKKVAFVQCYIDVLDTVNESRTMWSNPELSFYGYCHIRSYKQSIGNPVQINQRNQMLFAWFPQENIVSINTAQLLNNLLGAISATLTSPAKFQLSSPLITDLSFGFQRKGKYFVVVTVGYFKEETLPPPAIVEFSQNIPNPQDVIDYDPSGYKDLGFPDAAVDPPYVPENNDFGESEDAPELPGDPPAAVPFRIRYSFQTPDGQTFTELTVQYSGATPTSISVTPVKRDGVYVATVRYDGGTAYIPYRSSFATPEQEDAFVSTWSFVEYVYD